MMRNVLVVEDTVTDREVLVQCLRRSGLDVVSVNSGEAALASVQNRPPDLIVLDIVLPGMSGFEICRDLKNTPATAQIPVVLCSSKGTDMDKFWGMRQGANAYLAKPIDQEELVITIQRLLGK